MYRHGKLYAAGLHMAIVVAIVIFLSGLGGTIAPVITYAAMPSNNTSPIDNASVSPANYPDDIYGYVFDSNGKKVPHAHVTLYKNDTYLWLPGNPAFTNNDGDNDPGRFGFPGIDLGSYTIRAEITDTLGYMYNGIARVKKLDDRSVQVNVTIQGYVYSPWIEATPTPEPIATAGPVPAIMSSGSKPNPTARQESASDGFNPIYVLALPPVAIVGGIIFLRYKKRWPANTASNKEARGAGALTYSVREPARMSLYQEGNRTLSEHYIYNDEYRNDIDEFFKKGIQRNNTDIAMINMIDGIAKKHGVDQITIYRDIKILKILMQRSLLKERS